MTTRPAAQPAPATTAGVWLGATHALGRPIRADKPYPHLCGATVAGLMTTRQVQLGWRECAACMERRATRRSDRDIPPPSVDAAALAAGDAA